MTIIGKNKHYSYSLHFFNPTLRTSMKRRVQFSEKCWWKNPRNYDEKFAINKLFGFSHGFHHNNSIRFGWVPDFDIENHVKIYAYYYNNKIRSQIYITTISTLLWFTAEIKIINNNATLTINNKKTNFYYKLPKCILGYELYPYFGGNNTAPNKLEIKIEK